MPDDLDHRPISAAAGPTAAALLALLVLAAPLPARSQDLRGYVQVQYQKLQNGRDLDLSFNREYWVTSFQVNYATKLRPDLSLSSQVQFTNLDYTGSGEGTRQPYLSLRLLHPWAGFYGAFRPTTQTDIIGHQSKQEQTVLSAYWNRPRWPRLDLSWIHRRLEQGGLDGSGTTRYALLGYTLGGLTVHGGYTDESNQPDQAPEKRVIQRAWTGGAMYLWSRPTASLLMQYDFNNNERGDPSSNTDVVQTQTVNVNGGKRFSARNDATIAYLYRLTRSQSFVDQTYHDQETNFLFNHRLARPVLLSAGAGGRTLRTGLVSNFETYVLATATASGRLRQHWTGLAGATYSINWLEYGRPYAANTYTLSTIMGLRPGIDVNGSANVTLNGRPALAVSDSAGNTISGRVSSQVNLGTTLTPRRSFTLGYLFTGYNAGEGLTGATTRSTTGAWNVRWIPCSIVQITGNLTNTISRGRNQPKQTTSRVNLQWNPSRTTQLTGSYARSDYPRVDPTIPRVPGHETVNLTLLTALTRLLVANVAFNWSDPASNTSVRQFDATVTRRFGG